MILIAFESELHQILRIQYPEISVKVIILIIAYIMQKKVAD